MLLQLNFQNRRSLPRLGYDPFRVFRSRPTIWRVLRNEYYSCDLAQKSSSCAKTIKTLSIHFQKWSSHHHNWNSVVRNSSSMLGSNNSNLSKSASGISSGTACMNVILFKFSRNQFCQGHDIVPSVQCRFLSRDYGNRSKTSWFLRETQPYGYKVSIARPVLFEEPPLNDWEQISLELWLPVEEWVLIQTFQKSVKMNFIVWGFKIHKKVSKWSPNPIK